MSKPSISMGLFAKQLARINRQYHDYGELHLRLDETGQLVKVCYTDENGHQAPLTDWLEPIETRRYLHNFQQLFCLDPARLDRFFELSEASIILPIEMLTPTRKRRGGITRAFFNMRATYYGKRPRRKPLEVIPGIDENGKFSILDGNSTYFMAKQIGIQAIPIRCTLNN
ncbi:hypothetical protein NC796_02195 [Aliifodinibius sp. S!AR15-10]|nr:hypothetical protein [Aliifodinibius sp. S!AR15-10]